MKSGCSVRQHEQRCFYVGSGVLISPQAAQVMTSSRSTSSSGAMSSLPDRSIVVLLLMVLHTSMVKTGDRSIG